MLRGSSHYAAQVERQLPKLLSRGEGRNPLKYIMSVLLSDFEYFIEKSSVSQLEFGFPFSVCPNSCREVELLAPKVPISCHVGILKAFHFWSLATSMKAKRSYSHSPSIKLLDFIYPSTVGSVETSSISHVVITFYYRILNLGQSGRTKPIKCLEALHIMLPKSKGHHTNFSREEKEEVH